MILSDLLNAFRKNNELIPFQGSARVRQTKSPVVAFDAESHLGSSAKRQVIGRSRAHFDGDPILRVEFNSLNESAKERLIRIAKLDMNRVRRGVHMM